MLHLFPRRAGSIEVETEVAMAEREHDIECAILYGASLMGGPLPEAPMPTPKPLRRRRMKRFRAHRWPRVYLD